MKSREKNQPPIPVTHCAWCGSYDLGIGWQQNEAIVTFRQSRGGSRRRGKGSIRKESPVLWTGDILRWQLIFGW